MHFAEQEEYVKIVGNDQAALEQRIIDYANENDCIQDGAVVINIADDDTALANIIGDGCSPDAFRHATQVVANMTAAGNAVLASTLGEKMASNPGTETSLTINMTPSFSVEAFGNINHEGNVVLASSTTLVPTFDAAAQHTYIANAMAAAIVED